MGAIVGATLCAHVPRLMMTPEEKEKYMGAGGISTLDQALTQMYEEQIKNLDFDTFLIFDTHWYTTTNFYIDGRDQHVGCYTSDEVPEMIHDYNFLYRGDPELARLISEEAGIGPLKGRVRVTNNAHMPHHYPTLVTMRYLNPDPDSKRLILPTSVAYTSSVLNEFAYGKAIRRAIERSNRRVVLVATGGLSHRFHDFDDIPSKTSAHTANIYSKKHMAADLKMIRLLGEGLHAKVVEKSLEFIWAFSPEGKFAHYLRMVAALGCMECTIPAIQYGKYESAIGTGQVVLWFPVKNEEVQDARNS